VGYRLYLLPNFVDSAGSENFYTYASFMRYQMGRHMAIVFTYFHLIILAGRQVREHGDLPNTIIMISSDYF
jgi:hypothetical protein